jgi:hypothetical protein
VAEEAEDVAEAEVKDTMLYVEYGVWFGPAWPEEIILNNVISANESPGTAHPSEL